MIDIPKIEVEISDLIESSVTRFGLEHPEVIVSSFCLWADHESGWAVTAFDTKENSDSCLHKAAAAAERTRALWLQHGSELEWDEIHSYCVGLDSFGEFGANCWDFAYPSAGEFEFPDWPGSPGNPQPEPVWQFRFSDENIETINLDLEWEQGGERQDRRLGQIVFDMLFRCMHSFSGYRKLKRAPIFRLGVQLKEKWFSRFWLPDEKKPYVRYERWPRYD